MGKKENMSIFDELLVKVLKRDILSRIEWRKKKYGEQIKYHHHTVNGLAKKLADIIIYSIQNPKYIDGKFDGYHIYSTDIQIINKNKLSEYFIFFDKSPNSTYHANNGRGSVTNGYSHWYIYSEFIEKSVRLAKYLAKRQILYNKTYKRYEKFDKLKIWLASRNTKLNKTNKEYFKIERKIFIKEFRNFQKGLCNEFIKLIRRILFIDSKYVYFDNCIKNSSLDGFGREYTTVGNLSKSYRKLLLNGYTEIDVSCAIQLMLVNLYYFNNMKPWKKTKLNELKNNFPNYYQLICDKVNFRRKIAKSFGCDESLAKEIITSISYSPKRRVIHQYCKMRKHELVNQNYKFTKDFTKAQIAKCKKLIFPFINETEKLRETVLEKFYYQNKDFNKGMKIGELYIRDFREMIDEDIRIDNHKKGKKNKGYGRGKRKEDRILFRIYELIECQIRKQMIEFLKLYNIDECYQIHDCVIFKGDIDLRYLTSFIYQNLNLKFFFTKEQYNYTRSFDISAPKHVLKY